MENYCRDDWSSLNTSIPGQRIFQEKEKTFSIAQKNSQQRHWVARFRGKLLTHSGSLEMIDITMRIFTAIHVNNPSI